jgi:hypothetical protein
MKLMAIDIIGTVNELIKRSLKEILLLLGIILFGLSAPLLFTVGIEILMWKGADMSIWAPVYFFLGPFACAIWMVFICHFHSIRRWQRAGKLDTWREDHGGIFRTVGKSMWFMIGGFFGSAITEGIFLYVLFTTFPQGIDRTGKMLVFAVAPLFVFTPVLLVLLSRWIRRNKYAAVV